VREQGSKGVRKQGGEKARGAREQGSEGVKIMREDEERQKEERKVNKRPKNTYRK
jgi:hypothetical protein